jgi:hypothetical protein
MDFILSGWYLRRKNHIVSIKYITHRMKRTLRVKCSTKIVYSFENFNFIGRISKICVYMFMCTSMFNYFYIHVCAMIIIEYILYIVLIKRGKIPLVGENRKKWYGGRLHLIHDAPPLIEVIALKHNELIE